MLALHESYLSRFRIIKKLYQKYSFSTLLSEIEKDISNIADFKVTVPLVGGFSTGKSSLINGID